MLVVGVGLRVASKFLYANSGTIPPFIDEKPELSLPDPHVPLLT